MLEVGPLQIVPDEHLARADGRALMLSIRELRLLTELARRADRIVTREDLFALVWGREMRVRDRSVDVYVRKLRVKLESPCPGGRSSIPTSGWATGWLPNLNRPSTAGSQLGNTLGPRRRHSGPHMNKEMTVRLSRIGGVATALITALAIAACGSSSSSSSSSAAAGGSSCQQLKQRCRHQRQQHVGHDQRRRLDAGGPDLPAVGQHAEGQGPDRQLQPGRLGRRPDRTESRPSRSPVRIRRSSRPTSKR